jgi:CRP/FNR family cyclic AMP-dependent transcriptional regulator
MSTSTTTISEQVLYEDVLEHLPVSKTIEYRKGEIIYGLGTVPRKVYLVIRGTVGISHAAENGIAVLVDVVRPDELFGESAFLPDSRRTEVAEAIEPAEVMSWTLSEMEDLLTKRPRLAVALLQIQARRNAEYMRRIESFAMEGIARRLARSLLRLGLRIGSPEEGGSVKMMPLTHQMLGRYVGTSRAVVTHHMNAFRKQGYVTYSRAGISFRCDTLKTILDQRLPATEQGASAPTTQ